MRYKFYILKSTIHNIIFFTLDYAFQNVSELCVPKLKMKKR